MAECVQNQICFTEQTFMEALNDTEYEKFIVRHKATGEIAAFGMLSGNLQKAAAIAYANPEKLSDAFPDRVGRIYYFPVIYVLDRYKRASTFEALIAPMVRFVDRHRGVAAFDFSTNKNPHLPEMIMRVVRQIQGSEKTNTASGDYTEIGKQIYGAIALHD